MHELSIAHSLVEIAVAAAERAEATRVLEVQVVIGAFAGVSVDALLFSYDIATGGTLLAGSRLAVRTVPLVVHCPVCEREVELPDMQRFRCPLCGTPTADIRRGRELFVEGLEIETAVEAAAGERP